MASDRHDSGNASIIGKKALRPKTGNIIEPEYAGEVRYSGKERP